MPDDELDAQIRELQEKIKQRDERDSLLNLFKNYRGQDEVVSSEELVEILGEEPEPEWEIKTGLPTLDKCITGLLPGNLFVISGPTGQGKSKIAETLTRNINDQGYRSLWFTFEMPARELMKRFGSKPPVFYLPKKIVNRKLVWLEERIIEAIAKYGVTCVFIDHLHFLLEMGQIQNSSLELGGVVRAIKLLALKYNIVIFLIAHTKKTRYDEKMTLDSIRDSSFIAQEADFVLMLARETLEDSNGQLVFGSRTRFSVQKNRRNGNSRSFVCQLVDSRFIEIEEVHDE